MGSLGRSSTSLITGIAHINLVVPAGTLDVARDFYGNTLGLTNVPVPKSKESKLAWFDITPGGQQIHIAVGPAEAESGRHPCFKIDDEEALWALQSRIYERYKRGGEGTPRSADKPGEEACASEVVGFPTRFFARDFAGNRLEFSL